MPPLWRKKVASGVWIDPVILPASREDVYTKFYASSHTTPGEYTHHITQIVTDNGHSPIVPTTVQSAPPVEVATTGLMSISSISATQLCASCGSALKPCHCNLKPREVDQGLSKNEVKRLNRLFRKVDKEEEQWERKERQRNKQNEP